VIAEDQRVRHVKGPIEGPIREVNRGALNYLHLLNEDIHTVLYFFRE